MRRAVNSYAVRAQTIPGYGSDLLERAWAGLAAMPNYGWLALIILTFAALSVTTMIRARGAESQAQARKAEVALELEVTKSKNLSIRTRTEKMKGNGQVGEAVARERLRLVGRNEAVVRVSD